MPLIYPMISNEFQADAVLRFYGNSKLGTASLGWFPFSTYTANNTHIVSDPNQIFGVELRQSGAAYNFTLGDDANVYTIDAEIVDNTMYDVPNPGTGWFSAAITWWPGITINNSFDEQQRLIDVFVEGTPVAAGTTASKSFTDGDGLPDRITLHFRTDTNTTTGSLEGYVDVKLTLKGYQNYSPSS